MLKVLGLSVLAIVAALFVIGTLSPEPEDTTGIRHCFSVWNGSHPELVHAVRAGLHNPDSFEHVRTNLAGQDGAAQRTIVMVYRATNRMDGVVTSRASASIFPPRCDLSIISVEH